MAAPARLPAVLELANGARFHGWSFGARRSVAGEAVFQTGMVGYPESLSDPSYSSQILILTYPSIGNYGVPDTAAVDPVTGLSTNLESHRIHAAALVAADYTDDHSHWSATQSLSTWLTDSDVPAIAGVDTRALTKIIRESGTMPARILVPQALSATGAPLAPSVPAFLDPNLGNLVAGVSVTEKRTFAGAAAGDPCAPRLLVIDCGIKYAQLRVLIAAATASVTLVPWDYDFAAEDEAAAFDGIFVSNGPGDPTMAAGTIKSLRQAMNARSNRPIFGICLGHQLLALAAGFSTYKLKYGNRGHNQPCTEISSGRCYITSQNHGYAVTASGEDTPVGWVPTYVNENDGTNEGVAHHTLPFFSVQFHPEATAGPHDTAFLFDTFVAAARSCRVGEQIPPLAIAARPSAPARARELALIRSARPKKVVVLGSGGLSIGQAGEFDYSGSQCIKALKEEGIQTVLINPNIATVQTSRGLADKVYFLPVTPENVIKVAEYEHPDGILLTFGGQTALNCGVELHKAAEFSRLGIKVLGTPVEAILDTEDRERFNARLTEINEPFAESRACSSIEGAVAAANEVGYPVILRAAFALGGLGSGFAHNDAETVALASKAFTTSSQVLVERSMRGWKEIEYEVVRDADDNCITVCNMENFDPLGVHTGDSIVIAPSQTLTDAEYHMLRDCAVKTVRHLGVVGECNIQYALHPDSMKYCIIEVNARLSRSSALASKATGYPLAFVAAKLALGLSLPSIRNSITKETTACFEPSLDYMVVKVPRWDLTKFTRVSRELGSAMKSVGEVMAIGRTFEEAIQKALRMVRDNYVCGFESGVFPYSDREMSHPTERRIFAIATGFAEGVSVEKIHELSCIDNWFLKKLAGISRCEQSLRACSNLTTTQLVHAKELGFSDRHVSRLMDDAELAIRKMRTTAGIRPFVKQIDTVAAEFPAKTNYLYVTYASTASSYAASQAIDWPSELVGKRGEMVSRDDLAFDAEGVIVLGSGAYRIGSSVEFDWCAVSGTRTLRSQGYGSVMINYNPETVSTDYDECDRLYFEELSFERVLDIYETEKSSGIIVSMGGQIPNNIAMQLHRQNARILGTTPEMIDGAENRYKFSRMLDRIGVDQPLWKELSSIDDAKAFCNKVGYPVLVRPSFVLSGAAMNVVHKAEDLELYLSEASAVSPDCPVVISKFILEAKEIEVDAVAKKGELMMHVVSEHVENAGVHSGDATLVLPPQDLDEVTVRKVEEATAKVAMALNVTGPLNIQFIAKDNEIKVIECNLRASRSFPFVSKTVGLNLAKMATKVMLGLPVKPYPVNVADIRHVGVKVSQFSFTRLAGADPVLGVEMASTGEVACFGKTREEAYLKGLVASSHRVPTKTIGVSIGTYKEKLEFLASAKLLVSLGMKLIATPGTADFFQEHGVPAEVAVWTNPEEFSASENENTIDKMLADGRVEYFINIPSTNSYRRLKSFESPGYLSRRSAVDFNVPLLTNIKCAKLFVKALAALRETSLPSHKLSPHDARFSSRVITLPGLVLLDAAVDPSDASSHGPTWQSTTEEALKGGFSVVCVSASASAGTPEEFVVEAKVASGNAVTDFLMFAAARPGNAAIVQPLGSVAGGLKISSTDAANVSGSAASSWLEHFETWPAQSPLFLEGHGSSLAGLLFGSVVSGRGAHVCSVSTADDMRIVRASKDRGLAVTCDVNVLDLFSPPGTRGIKTSDQEALWESLDVIDAVTGPPAMILPLLLSSVHLGRISMEWVTSRLSDGPRRILGLPDSSVSSSSIEVDIGQEWLSSTSSGLPGAICRGRVQRVLVNDAVAYLDGKVWSKPGSGNELLAASAAVVSSPKSTVIHPAVMSSSMNSGKSGDAFGDKYGDELPPSRSSIAIATRSSGARVASRLPSANGAVPTVAGMNGLGASTDGLDGPLAVRAEVLPGYGAGWWSGRHIISVKQFAREELHELFEIAQDMRSIVARVGHYDLLRGKVMAALFYEPSTRTSCSFQAAMQRLGGTCLAIQDVSQSSVSKGESLSDTVRTIGCYADVLVIRHPDIGSAEEAASKSHLPVINAGDGVGEHPTQALLDVYTIREELGTVNGLSVTFVGDLKNGRTVHSLARLLSLYSVKINYVSPATLRVPEDVLEAVASRGVEQSEHESLDSVIQETDVLYVTRAQKERFSSVEEYERIKGAYRITPKLLTRAKENMIVMHPLPRVGEISEDVDSDPRAVYFRQMEHGMYIRMALLAVILGKS